jgi:hypothetical protein
MDFMHGAALAPRGRPILALPATDRAPKARAGTPPYALSEPKERIQPGAHRRTRDHRPAGLHASVGRVVHSTASSQEKPLRVPGR